MPNTREKLVELLYDADKEAVNNCRQYPNCYGCPYTAPNGCYVGAEADHLIANGVTFAKDIYVLSKWISVKDRLPEDNSNVLGCLKIGEESRIYPAFYAHGVWFDCIFNETTTNYTTHWMPLPQPPKGE